MIKFKQIVVAILTLSSTLYAGEFKFNNKNLNSLGAIICQETTKENQQLVTAHKININKYRNSDRRNDMRYEIIGTCDIKYDAKTRKIVSLGDEFTLNFHAHRFQQIEGRLGIKKIFFNFRKKELHSLVIIDPLLQTTQRIYLNKSQWAKSDTIFNFNKKNLEVKIARNTAAIENNSLLEFKDASKTHFFNLWSFESFGCSNNTQTISATECQDIVSEIN